MSTELESELDQRLTELGDQVGAATQAVAVDELTKLDRSGTVGRRPLMIAAGLVAASAAAIAGVLGVLPGTGNDSSVHALPANVAWYAVVAPAEQSAATEYSTCMLDAGFDEGTIGLPPLGRIASDSVWSDPDHQRAFRRCIVEAGIGEVEGDDPVELAAKNAKAIGVTSCMRVNGWAMPDPTLHPVAGYLVAGGPDIPADPADAKRQREDLTTCAAKNDIAVVFD